MHFRDALRLESVYQSERLALTIAYQLALADRADDSDAAADLHFLFPLERFRERFESEDPATEVDLGPQ